MSDGGRKNLDVPSTCTELPGGGITLTDDHAYVVPRNSASSSTNFKACRRMWWFQKVALCKEIVPGVALVRGSAVHDLLEKYLKGGAKPDPHGGNLEAIAAAGLHLLPAPGTIGVEDSIDLTSGPIKFKGYVDMYDLSRSDVPRAGWDGLLWIGDHKTSADPKKWGKTPHELARNPQLLAYAYGLVKGQGIPEPAPDELIALTHVYYRTRGAPFGMRVDTTAPWSRVLDNWRNFERTSNEMFSLSKVDRSASIPPNRASCGRFGGCPMSSICSSSPKNRAKANASKLLAPIKHESTMSDQRTTDRQAAMRKALLGTAAKATPEPSTGINPPDAAPEINQTDAMIQEAAGFVTKMLNTLGALNTKGFDRIMARQGIAPEAVPEVLAAVGAGWGDDGKLRLGLAPPAKIEAPAPEPSENANLIEAIDAALTKAKGTMKMTAVKLMIKAAQPGRLTAKRIKQICLDAEIAGLWKSNEELTLIETMTSATANLIDDAPGPKGSDHLAALGAQALAAQAQTPAPGPAPGAMIEALKAKQAEQSRVVAPKAVDPNLSPDHTEFYKLLAAAQARAEPTPAPTRTPQERAEFYKKKAEALESVGAPVEAAQALAHAAAEVAFTAQATIKAAVGRVMAPVVYVNCWPDGGAEDFAVWIGPVEDQVQKAEGRWPYSMGFNDGQKAVASRLITALRDGVLTIPPALAISSDHPASAQALSILARAGVTFVRGTR